MRADSPFARFLAFLVAMTRNDPVAAAALIVGWAVLPALAPITILAPLYWIAWWTLLACLAIATAQGKPLGVGWGLSAAVRALVAPRRVAATSAGGSAGAATEGGETPQGQSPQDEGAASRLREALRAYVTEEAEGVVVAVNGPEVVWTGTRMTPEERRARELEVLANLEGRLRERVKGQDHVHRAIARHLLRQAAGVREARRRPLLTALFAGPTGTGKTETAKALAEALGRPLLVYDMGNYHDVYTVAALVGAPPGYIGSDRPGRLVTDVQRAPNAVLLFDEIEKAHPQLWDPFLAVFDEGRLVELSQGLQADFTETVIVMTTNLLQREALQSFTEDMSEVRRMLLHARPSVQDVRFSGGLRPELVNRIDVVVLFRPLGREILEEVARSYISSYAQQVAVNQHLPALQVEIDEGVIDAVLEQCDLSFGARDLKRAVDGLIGDALVDGYIPWLTRTEKPTRLRIGLSGGRVVAEYRL